MSKHWYRNDTLGSNKLLSDTDVIPDGYSRESYSKFQSNTQSGSNHPNYGKHRSEDTKKKISQSNLGKKFSKEHREKLSIATKNRDWSNFHPNHKGKNNPRYGVSYTMSEDKKKSFLSKRYDTMMKNNSFNKSCAEESYYEYLLSLYDKDDILRQYKSIEYPFMCDFYIKSEDRYIECNFNWTHGPHPFNKDNLEDIKLLEQWKAKTTGKDYYSNAIYVWTDLDVRKRQIASQNNLNIEFIYNH